MSRIGKKPIPIPDKVQVKLQGNVLEVEGPQGNLTQEFPANIAVKIDEEKRLVLVNRPDDNKQSIAFHGLTRALLNNAITGASVGFLKTLVIVGTGYNAKLKGKHIELQIGYCQPKVLKIPEGISLELPTPTKIFIRGVDKQKVGQFAADIRALRKPDSYKGKGIRYEDEVIKLKAGKSFAGGD